MNDGAWIQTYENTHLLPVTLVIAEIHMLNRLTELFNSFQWPVLVNWKMKWYFTAISLQVFLKWREIPSIHTRLLLHVNFSKKIKFRSMDWTKLATLISWWAIMRSMRIIIVVLTNRTIANKDIMVYHCVKNTSLLNHK